MGAILQTYVYIIEIALFYMFYSIIHGWALASSAKRLDKNRSTIAQPSITSTRKLLTHLSSPAHTRAAPRRTAGATRGGGAPPPAADPARGAHRPALPAPPPAARGGSQVAVRRRQPRVRQGRR